MRTISYETYFDKVLGGWIGQRVGSILDASADGMKRFNDINTIKNLANTNGINDALDLQLVWLDMVKTKGPHVRERDFGDQWQNHVRLPQNEFGIASRNLKLGIYPPQSGEHNNEYWKTGMGSPIRSEIWGMLNPGMPAQAAYFASLDSFVDHDDFSIDAERFLSAMASEAFFENDMPTIIETVAHIFEHQCPFTDLLDYALELREECRYDIAIEKMKSRYGDAHVANAPMNIGVLLLALLYHNANFDNLNQTLFPGYNNSGIAAITGGLYGIVIGASKIDPAWRERCGDEQQTCSGIVGIQHPATLTDLANETCRAGLNFIDYFKQIQIFGKDLKPYPLSPSTFNLNTILVDYEPGMLVDEQWIDIEYENLTMEKQKVEIYLSSDELEFSEPDLEFEIDGLEFKAIKTTFSLLPEAYEELISPDPKYKKSAYSYDIDITINGEKQQTLTRGVPFYGTWLMFGPFMSDDPSLETMDDSPEHHHPSLPSYQHTNHDKIGLDNEFITIETVRDILKEENFEEYPFQIEPLNPESFKMNLTDYFEGRGEKTVYLYSKIFSQKAKKTWLVMGCSAYIRVWWNGEKVFERRDIRRCWPGDITIPAKLQKGQNDILIRIDMPIDQVDFVIGFKEHIGTHPNQSYWDTELVPFV